MIVRPRHDVFGRVLLNVGAKRHKKRLNALAPEKIEKRAEYSVDINVRYQPFERRVSFYGVYPRASADYLSSELKRWNALKPI